MELGTGMESCLLLLPIQTGTLPRATFLGFNAQSPKGGSLDFLTLSCQDLSLFVLVPLSSKVQKNLSTSSPEHLMCLDPQPFAP